MIIYSVTVHIDDEIHDKWVEWMRIKHIPAVMNTGCFLEARFSRVNANVESGVSYSVQYLCSNEETLNKYANEFAADLQKEHREMFNDKFEAFRITLNVVEVFK